MQAKLSLLIVSLGMIASGCSELLGPRVEAPANLRYTVEASGDPERPGSVLLEWDPVIDDDLAVYNIYSRPASDAVWDLRASTTSTSYHDQGIPDLEYRVTAEDFDGRESQPSREVRIYERTLLQAPDFLETTSLNGAVHLFWADNAFKTSPDAFKQYRIYSTTLDIDANLCDEAWALEGTTVAPEFLVGVLTNGVPRCFAVSAESDNGWESLWSEIRGDTPRPDARNVLMFPLEVDQSRSGFRFFQDLNGDGQAGPLELGIVGDGSSPSVDFWVHRDAAGDLFLVPLRTGTQVALYGTTPVADLTSIDIAPDQGFDVTGIQAVPGWGYVFQMLGGDGFPRYGALRVTHASADYLIFDWSYQTDPGNPELLVQGVRTEGWVIRR